MCRASHSRYCHAAVGPGRQTVRVMTSSINGSAPDLARVTLRSRSGLRRAVAGLAIVALLSSACGSGEDTVSSDAAEAQSVETAEAPADADSAQAPVEVDAVALQQNGPITVTGTALDPYDSTVNDLSIGTAAPVVEGESFDGTPITIGGPTNNPTFVVFLAHWCSHCNEEVPELIELEEAGRIPEGLDVIGVSTAVVADRDNYPPSEWIDDRGWPWPTMADDEELSAINAMGGTSFPFAVVLDTDGTVLARRAGQATGDETVAFLEAALANV
jgi:cytochrome c biogenesis protein CcmG/thiol:disulfide interchange protein DsbE